MGNRTESDALGKVEIKADCYWGSQTERSRKYFAIGTQKMPLQVVTSLILIKKHSAIVNSKAQILPQLKRDLIISACDKLLSGDYSAYFPLSLWQTGSGTHTNMNVNEVIANIANEAAGSKLGSKAPVHPNDDVNMSQSTNDVFPAAMHLSACEIIVNNLLPELLCLEVELNKKCLEFAEIKKVGRTHLMDAVTLTLGQEFSGFSAQIATAIRTIKHAVSFLLELPIGGTAVGTGINTPPKFAENMAQELSFATGHEFVVSSNFFAQIAAHDAFAIASGALKTTAVALVKISSDISLLASGPRCGLGELIIPANEPGSSMMPGKINPTQCEALSMICARVIGNDATITFAASQGKLQLNTYKPIIIYALLESLELLTQGCASFNRNLLVDLRANKPKIRYYLENSLMVATALTPKIGYDKTCEIVKKAALENKSVKEACLELNYMSEAEFDQTIL